MRCAKLDHATPHLSNNLMFPSKSGIESLENAKPIDMRVRLLELKKSAQ